MGFLEFTERISETIPSAGSRIMYTSGCPKNQNKCWNRMAEPPSLGSISPLTTISERKKLVPRLRSNNNNTAPDNNTGKERTPNTAVKNIAHMVRGILVMLMPFVLIFKMV
jgi:hypothetical protein